MKKEDLFEAINDIDDEYINTADNYRKTRKHLYIVSSIAAAATLFIAVGATIAVTGIAHGTSETATSETATAENGTSNVECACSATGHDDSDLNDNNSFVASEEPYDNQTLEFTGNYSDTSYELLWGGMYVDESGNTVVLITDDAPEYQQTVLDQNPDIDRNNVVFVVVKYPLLYLEETKERIDSLDSEEKIPGLISCYVCEEDNCVEILFEAGYEENAEILIANFEEGVVRVAYE